MDDRYWGETDEQGNIVRETQVDALTGKTLKGKGVRFDVAGTRRFYRLSKNSANVIYPEERDVIETRIREAKAAPLRETRRRMYRRLRGGT